MNQLEQMIITGYLEQFTTIVDTDRILHKIRTEDITYVNSIRHLKAIHTTNSIIQTRDYSFDDLISMTNNGLQYSEASVKAVVNFMNSVTVLKPGADPEIKD